MQERPRSRLAAEHGFTLIELPIVATILGILAKTGPAALFEQNHC